MRAEPNRPPTISTEGRWSARNGCAVDAAAIAAASTAHPFLADHLPSVEIVGGRFGSARIPSDHPLPLGLAQVAAATTGRAPQLLGEPYGADMRLFVNEGQTPCVIFGPGDVRVAHSADEFVPLDQVADCARVLAAWVVRELTQG